MQGMWPTRLSVDAFGAVSSNVSVRHGAMAPYVRVQLGTLVAHCVDAEAVASAAAAWAMAGAFASAGLPVQPRAARDVVDTWSEQAQTTPVPIVSEIVLAGRSRWRVVPPSPKATHALVSTGWLTVRVFDMVALDIHTRVWAQASDLGRRAWPEHPPPRFRDLELRARFRAVALAPTVTLER